MPKLTAKVAKSVDAAEAMGGSFLLPEGHYAAQLKSVDQKDGNEYPYWVWTFENLHDSEGNKKPGRQWNNTSLSPKSLGFLKATFEAFGYTADSDTDEMIGEWVVLYLVQDTVGKGPKAGQLRNQVQSLSEFDPGEWEFDPEEASTASGNSGSDDEY